MIKVDLVDVIRRKHFAEGRGLRAIARELNLSRNTVRKYVVVESEPKRKEAIRRSPVRQAVEPRLRQILEEWASRTTRKQRVTGTRLHLELRREGYDVGLTLVRELLAEYWREHAEVFIPLIHRPGDEAQVDFFEVALDIAGQRRKGYMFVMYLMFSGVSFARIYEHCDQVSFLDGHVRAFEYFGGCPSRCVYDNLTAAVRRVVGPKRDLTGRFAALVRHYGFEADFTRVGEGHDKGGVESAGKGIRLACLTPVPRAASFEEASEALHKELEERSTFLTRGPERKKPRDLFELVERPALKSLAASPFQIRAVVPVSISSKSTFIFDGVSYSVPSPLAHLAAVAYIGPFDILVVCRGEEIVKQRKPRGERGIEYRHYLREFAKKPKAVRQVAPELVSELGSPYQQLWQILSDTHGSMEAARVLSRVIGAIVQHGEAKVTEAVRVALAGGRADLLNLRLATPTSEKRFIPVPASLAHIQVESVSPAAYNALLTLGAA